MKPIEETHLSVKDIQQYTIDKQKVQETFDKIHELYTIFANVINEELKTRKVSMSLGSKFHADLELLEKELGL